MPTNIYRGGSDHVGHLGRSTVKPAADTSTRRTGFERSPGFDPAPKAHAPHEAEPDVRPTGGNAGLVPSPPLDLARKRVKVKPTKKGGPTKGAGIKR